jgi:hypothetical protein
MQPKPSSGRERQEAKKGVEDRAGCMQDKEKGACQSSARRRVKSPWGIENKLTVGVVVDAGATADGRPSSFPRFRARVKKVLMRSRFDKRRLDPSSLFPLPATSLAGAVAVAVVVAVAVAVDAMTAAASASVVAAATAAAGVGGSAFALPWPLVSRLRIEGPKAGSPASTTEGQVCVFLLFILLVGVSSSSHRRRHPCPVKQSTGLQT